MKTRLDTTKAANTLKKGKWWLLGLVVVLGVSFVWLTTVGGKGRPTGRYAGAHDFIYFYAGGGCYRDGINPYAYDLYTRWAMDHLANHPQVDPSTRGVDTGYAYPPTAALPFWAIAHLPFNPARLLWLGLNGASLAVVLGVMWWAMRGGARSDPGRSDVPQDVGRWAWAGPVILAGFALLNPFTSHNMWMGQSSLIALAILCGAWWAKEKGHWLLCAFLTALATAKISMSVFFVLTLLVERRWRTFFATCAFCFVLAAIPLWHDGPLGVAQTWLESMKRYREARPSLPESTENFGMRSLAAVWFGVRSAGWEVVGLLAFALAAWGRKWFTSLEFFAASLALAALFVKGNDYDLVLLIPVLAACLIATAHSLGWTLLVVTCFAAMAFPKRIYLEKLGSPGMLRVREVVLLLVTVAIILRAMVWRPPTSRTAPAR